MGVSYLVKRVDRKTHRIKGLRSLVLIVGTFQLAQPGNWPTYNILLHLNYA